jgi:hypothetical protein
MAYLTASAWARGPATDQQAAEPACAPLPHGPKLARERPAASGRPSRWTAERAFRRDKTRSGGQLLPWQTLDHLLLLLPCFSLVHAAAAVGATRRRPAGDGEVEQALHGTRPRPAPLPSLLSFLFSLRLRLLPYRRDPERWPWWPAMAGVDEGRRPAHSRGRLLPLSTFFSCSSPSTLDLQPSEVQRARPWPVERMVAGAAAGPLAGARVHPRVSAPPSSGSVMAPVALSLTPTSGGGPAGPTRARGGGRAAGRMRTDGGTGGCDWLTVGK